MAWAEDVRRRAPDLTGTDFFRAFPIRDRVQRQRMRDSLAELGFELDTVAP